MRSILFGVLAIITTTSSIGAEAKSLPKHPSAMVFFNETVSLVGGKKGFHRKVHYDFDKPADRRDWTFDVSQFKPTLHELGSYDHNYFVRCSEPTASLAVAGKLRLTVDFRNEWTGRKVSCHIGGYVRMFK